MKQSNIKKNNNHFKKFSFEYFMFFGIIFGSTLNLLNVFPKFDKIGFWYFFIIDCFIIVCLFVLCWYIEDKLYKMKKNSFLYNFIEDGYIVPIMWANLWFIISLFDLWGILLSITIMVFFIILAVYNSIKQKSNNKKSSTNEMSKNN
jgi:hypothetical protein